LFIEEKNFFFLKKEKKKPYTIRPGDTLGPFFGAGKLDAPWCLAEPALGYGLLVAALAEQLKTGFFGWRPQVRDEVPLAA
jgi:hypothetical protein